jgi:hypothetical protein
MGMYDSARRSSANCVENNLNKALTESIVIRDGGLVEES